MTAPFSLQNANPQSDFNSPAALELPSLLYSLIHIPSDSNTISKGNGSIQVAEAKELLM